MKSINPATEEVIGEVKESSQADVTAAVSKARKAFESWSKTEYSDRAGIVQELINNWYKNKKELAEMITTEQGKPLKESTGEVQVTGDRAQWFVDNVGKILEDEEIEETSTRIVFEPLGVMGVISPWNYPLSNPSWKIVPGLLVGNTLVSKASEHIPLFGEHWQKMLKEAGAPDAVFQTITGAGEVGGMLVKSPVDQICMTGSTNTGRKIAESAGKDLKRVVLELGGSDPFIALEGVDIDEVVGVAMGKRFGNCGQICVSAKRFFIHESIYEEFKNKFVEKAKKLKVGNGMEDVDMGPLITGGQRDLLEKQVNDSVKAGAKILTGGKRIDGKGFFFEPTVMENVAGTRVMKEETFGPVAPLESFTTEEEAIKKANDTSYGLGANVWGGDAEQVERVAKAIESGMVWVNFKGGPNPRVPWIGRKCSGIGCELGKPGVRDLVKMKVIGHNP